MERILQFISVVTFLIPLFSSFLTLFYSFVIKKKSYKISIFFAYLTLFSSFVLTVIFFISNIRHFRVFENSIFYMSITSLSIIVLLFVSLVSLVIHLYSIKYMFDDEGYIRYFVLLDLMIWVIFGLVISGNIIFMLGFWHMMGVVLYFLLVHNYKRRQTCKYGYYTLFTHMLSDIPFLFAAYLIYAYYDTTNLDTFLSIVSNRITVHVLFFDITISSVIAFLIMLSAIIKSAQFPFHIWLPFTLEGPNPVSALMHAGIVNAGAFLANRFAPLFVFGESALHLALIAGFITAVLGSLLMLVQNDIKKALAYSTVGQMGYMMLEIGSGAFALAIYHMMVHGIFKASLFLGSGGVIGEARESNNISNKSIFDFYFKDPKEHLPSKISFFMIVLVAPATLAYSIFYIFNAFNYQSGTLFFFFAWASGVQAVYALYHNSKNFKRFLFFTTILYITALIWYLLAEHFFNILLFTNTGLLKELYMKAQIPNAVFYTMGGIILSVYMISWIFTYCKIGKNCTDMKYFIKVYNFFYRILVRDLYILDFATKYSKKTVDLSLAINKKLKY